VGLSCLVFEIGPADRQRTDDGPTLEIDVYLALKADQLKANDKSRQVLQVMVGLIALAALRNTALRQMHFVHNTS